jgi:hypothetical protein
MNENKETELQFKRNELLKRDKLNNSLFSKSNQSSTSTLEIINCIERKIKINSNGVLYFTEKKNVPVPIFVWSLLLHVKLPRFIGQKVKQHF